MTDTTSTTARRTVRLFRVSADDSSSLRQYDLTLVEDGAVRLEAWGELVDGLHHHHAIDLDADDRVAPFLARWFVDDAQFIREERDAMDDPELDAIPGSAPSPVTLDPQPGTTVPSSSR